MNRQITGPAIWVCLSAVHANARTDVGRMAIMITVLLKRICTRGIIAQFVNKILSKRRGLAHLWPSLSATISL
jgi:hypothetical protein